LDEEQILGDVFDGTDAIQVVDISAIPSGNRTRLSSRQILQKCHDPTSNALRIIDTAHEFNIEHEVGDFSEWDTTIVDSGDLSVAAAAGLGGTELGASFLLDDTNLLRLEKNITAPSSGVYSVRYYFDRTSLSMAASNFFTNFSVLGSDFSITAGVSFLASGGGVQQVRFTAGADGNNCFDLVDLSVDDGEHFAEAKCVRAASSVSSDGSVTWWLDGTQVLQNNSVDNFDSFALINRIRFDNVGVDAGTSGTFYNDQLAMNTSGAPIGRHEHRNLAWELMLQRLFDPDNNALRVTKVGTGGTAGSRLMADQILRSCFDGEGIRINL
jgi:hypothetical protein